MMARQGQPPVEYQFKPGQSGNPGGVSRERKRLLNEAAEIAARILHRQLEALEGVIAEDPTKERIVSELITGDIHRIVKEAIDRADGTPKAAVDHTSSDGSMRPQIIERVIVTASDKDG